MPPSPPSSVQPLHVRSAAQAQQQSASLASLGPRVVLAVGYATPGSKFVAPPRQKVTAAGQSSQPAAAAVGTAAAESSARDSAIRV